jgi:hypothetical protein
MFSDIKSNSSTLLIEVRDYLSLIDNLNSITPLTPSVSLNCAKGLFFVHLYGAWEFTVKAIIVRTIELINSSNTKIIDCKTNFLCLALNNHLDALSSVGSSKKWDKRHGLFSDLYSNEIVTITVETFPTDGKNIRKSQLESIWNSFCIPDPIFPRMELNGRITELVENRNKVAHGSDSASNVGRAFTPTDLLNRYNDINELCTYLILTFEDYINNTKYKK